MKFDVTIGNPPYNNGIYEEFINRFKSRYDCFVTPANWQGESNSRVSNIMETYAKTIVFYVSNLDIFPEISEMGGITYFLLDYCKTKSENCTVINKLLSSKFFNDRMERSVRLPDKTINLYNISVDIINKVQSRSKHNILEIFNNKLNLYQVDLSFREDDVKESFDKEIFKEYSVMHPYKVCNTTKTYGYISIDHIGRQSGLDKYKLIIHDRLGYGAIPDSKGKLLGSKEPMIYEPNTIPVDASICLYEDYSLENVRRYKKWIKSKLVRFLMFIGNVSSHYTNNSIWKYVIQPSNEYNINMVDNDIYEIYRLSDFERECIEYTIKDRDGDNNG